MSDTLKILDAFQERPVAYYKIFSEITGSLPAGVLLSQIIYWDKTKNHEEFWKTDKDFCDELAMGVKELRNAKQKVSKFVMINRKGVPAKTYYKLDRETLINEITSYAERDNQVMPKGHNQLCPKGITNIGTENTSENTTENNTPLPPLQGERNRKVYITRDNISREGVILELQSIIPQWNINLGEKREITEKLTEQYMITRKQYTKEQVKKALGGYYEAKKDKEKQYRLDPITFFKYSKGIPKYL